MANSGEVKAIEGREAPDDVVAVVLAGMLERFWTKRKDGITSLDVMGLSKRLKCLSFFSAANGSRSARFEMRFCVRERLARFGIERDSVG